MTARSERGLRADHVAEVIVSLPQGKGRGRRGSGYLVAAGRVLTAAHVVEGDVGVRVRFEAGRPGEWAVDATVVWRHDGIDVAVLALPERAVVDVRPVSLGKVGDQDAVLGCTAMGFPRFKLRADAAGRPFRDAEHMDAKCAVLANRREGTLDLRITAPPAADPDPERDAWEGMSGAAVFSGGYLVGVVSRHHRREGTGRVAAGRVDRWADALSATERAALERLLGHELEALPSAAPGSTVDLVQDVYRAHLADIAPELLDERQTELAELVSFCGGPEPYRWLQGRPWAGKTALAAWFALHPPRGVVPVWFFITARYAGQSDGDAYTAAVIDQLAAIAGREPAATGSPAALDGERRLLLRQAAERVAEDGGTLLLVVDGLDEDQSRVPGGSGTSIASLLPERPPSNVRVLVTSRPSPGIPSDVGGGHPLRHCPVVELATSAAARHTEHEAKYDLQRALAGDRLERDMVGLLTAARGTLTVEDLRELTGEPGYVVRQRLGSVFGRILRLRGSGFSSSAETDVTLYTTSRGYLFAHETLLVAAQQELGPDVDAYQERLHAWAATYERRGWPQDTPLYLLQPYGRLVALLADTGRATDLATDPRRRDRLREATGSDAACLAEIAAARETVRRADPDDLGASAALAAAGDLVARRNVSLHPDIPAVHARLGRVRQAIGLARSVFRPEDRARAVLAVARVLAQAGDRRAAGLAAEGLGLAEELVAGTVPARLDTPDMVARGMRATALALAGREEEVPQAFRERPRPHDGPSAKTFVKALVATAAVLRNPAGAAGLLRLAEESAELIEFLPDRVRALASIAEACSACGFPEDARRIYGSVAGLAGRRDSSDFENLYAVAAEALRDTRPSEAERLASLAGATLPQGEYEYPDAAWSEVTCGDVCTLVALDRTTEAHRLAWAQAVNDPGTLRAQGVTWSVVAEGWARKGAAAEAWAALERSRHARFLDGDVDDSTQRVVGLLARAGAAEQLVATLLTEDYSSPDGPSWWEAAEALAVLACHCAADDPRRSLELLHTAEHGHQSTAAPVRGVAQERLAVLAGALATAGRPDDAERLLAVLDEPDEHAWGLAAVSLAVAGSDPGRALRLAERAVDMSLEAAGGWALPSSMAPAVQALGWAGAADRVMGVLVELVRVNRTRTHGRGDVRAEAAAGLWPHDPELAGRLVDDVLHGVRDDPVLLVAHLLAAVGLHDRERGTRLGQLLDAVDEDHDGNRPTSSEVVLSLLTAATSPAAARSRLDAVVSQDGRLSLRGPRARGGAALAYAALGDHEAARTTARREEDAEQRADALAQLAAYAALLPADRAPVPFRDPYDITLLTRRLATLLLPPPCGPDLPRARALLAEVLTSESWHHAVPVLAAIDPDAALRVRDVVFAHLQLTD
ncbi:trypsin-like peptidase domain-containing protein [Streptomyces sp. AC550_RSS872]|uniref:trypsin-like peptidase domain-containing protein n=1 Tax=Streptomyces sp. AC550_RSS872 TaxID=2823689 RepID=UPI001C26EBFA|nr:trypsin-like peptidase domain-containing protein [Streptomyces sp. AC550_RSS872]